MDIKPLSLNSKIYYQFSIVETPRCYYCKAFDSQAWIFVGANNATISLWIKYFAVINSCGASTKLN